MANEEEDADEKETAAEKRVRLAQEYLRQLEQDNGIYFIQTTISSYQKQLND